MIDLEYQKFGFLRTKMVWFAEQLPPINGFDYIQCYCCYRKIPHYFPFLQKKSHTIHIDLSPDTDRLFAQIYPKRRQKIRRAYKEKIQITIQDVNQNLLKEFISLYRKFQVPRGNYIMSPWSIKALQYNLKVFKGTQDDQILIMDLVVYDGCTAQRWVRARNEAVKSQASTYIGGALIWEIIKYFKRNGHQVLDLGGNNYFKYSFGGDIVPSYEYTAILSPIAKLITKGLPIFSRLPCVLQKPIFAINNSPGFSSMDRSQTMDCSIDTDDQV